MSESQFHRNHNQHVSLSEHLSDEIKNSGQDALKEISNMNKEMSDRLLIKVVNITVKCILDIIPDLEDIVIKSTTEKENNADLKDLVKKLSQYCYELVQGYDSDSSNLKQNFINFVQNILANAEGLLNIIKKDDLHDFKHDLVENLKEIMLAIQRIQSRILVENYKQHDIKNLIEKIQKEYVKDISIIENCGPDILKTADAHLKFKCKHAMKIAYYFNKVASNYHDIEIQHKLLEVAKMVNIASTSHLVQNEKFSNTKEAMKIVAEVSLNCWNSCIGLYELVDSPQNNKITENLSDTAKYVVSYGIVLNAHTGKGIKNDALFA